ncbi:MAG: ketopantoate reductase family protein [Candidatus Lokiarchaeota archaeon]|nr:ketopantoate reductase family protein [Candidatus Lokiarchaeota archaeon]
MNSNLSPSSILIYGAGAIGCTLYKWLYPNVKNLYLLARGETAEIIRLKGLTVYENTSDRKDQIPSVSLIERMEDLMEEPEIIIITVKNYSLEEVCQDIRNKTQSKDLIIVTLQNGIVNLKIVPKYFPRVIFGVICYNAWRDKTANVIGFKEKGPIILGTPQNTLQKDLDYIQSIFTPSFDCTVTSRYVDAAHNKILLNLTNAFFTLIGLGFRLIPSLPKFRKLTTAIMTEGLQILKKAGYKEVKLGSLPSWFLLRLASSLPGFITNSIFRKTLEKTTGINSMAQDLLINKSLDTELESINGYFINLAKKNGFEPAINQKLYNLCKREFSKEEFQPMSIESVWEEFREELV